MAIGTVGYPTLAKSNFDPVGSFQEGQANSLAAELNRKNIAKAELYNKYYGPNIESEMALRGAQTGLAESSSALNRQEYQNPGLRGTEFTKELAIQQMMGNMPQGAPAPNQTPAPQGAQPQQPFYSPTNGMTPEQQVLYQNLQARQTPAAPQPTIGMPPQMAGMTMAGQGAPVAAQPAYSPIQDQQQIQQAQIMHQRMAGLSPEDQQRADAMQPGDSMVVGEGQAQANRPMTQREMQQKHLENMLAQQQADVNYKNQGGGRGSVDIQAMNSLVRSVARENPNFTPDQAYEAAGNLTQGMDSLSDGTPINASGLTVKMADKVATTGVPAAVTTGNMRANQAHAELEVISKKADELMAPYANTGLLNMNIEQVADTFKSDKTSQEKLGDFIAAQAAQYEVAQLRIRLAQGQSGEQATRELMQLSGQMINSKFPMLSATARQRASTKLNEVLSEGLSARNEYGTHASKLGLPVKSSGAQTSAAGETNWIIDKDGKLVKAGS